MGCHGSGEVADTSIIGRIVGRVMSREMECPDCGGIATARMPAELIRLYDELNYVPSLCDVSKIAKEKLVEIKDANEEAWWKKLNELRITEIQGPNSDRPVLRLELIGD